MGQTWNKKTTVLSALAEQIISFSSFCQFSLSVAMLVKEHISCAETSASECFRRNWRMVYLISKCFSSAYVSIYCCHNGCSICSLIRTYWWSNLNICPNFYHLSSVICRLIGYVLHFSYNLAFEILSGYLLPIIRLSCFLWKVFSLSSSFAVKPYVELL